MLSWTSFGCSTSHWQCSECSFWYFTPAVNFEAAGLIILWLYGDDGNNTTIISLKISFLRNKNSWTVCHLLYKCSLSRYNIIGKHGWLGVTSISWHQYIVSGSVIQNQFKLIKTYWKCFCVMNLAVIRTWTFTKCAVTLTAWIVQPLRQIYNF